MSATLSNYDCEICAIQEQGGSGLPGTPHLGTQYFPGVSLPSKVVTQLLRMTVKPAIGRWSRFPDLAWPFGLIDAAARRFIRPIPGTIRHSVALPDCGAEWIQAAGVDSDRVILYLHGGAFVCCGIATHRRMVSQISAESEAPALIVDYRMMPHFQIADAIADCVSGYRWLVDQGYEANQIVIAGDSAGGYLAFMTALTVLDKDWPRPAGVVAISPLTNMDLDHKLAHPNADRDAIFPRGALDALDRYADTVSARLSIDGTTHLRPSPVESEQLHKMPPTLIQVASTEVLFADAQLMAHQLSAAGVPCELQVWEGQFHVFQAAADLVPEGADAIRKLGRFVKQVTPAVDDRLSMAHSV